MLPEVYLAGREILFSGDALKSFIEPSASSTLIKALETSAASLVVLPRLFQTFIQSARKNHTLFGQGISSAAEMHSAAMRFFTSCEGFVRSAPGELANDAHTCRLTLLSVMEGESLLSHSQPESYQILQELATTCISELGEPPSGTRASH
jgi:hypothetical protein